MDHLLGKKLLYTVIQFLTDYVLSFDCRGKVGAKGYLDCMLSPNSVRLGNPKNPLGQSQGGVTGHGIHWRSEWLG